MERKFSSGAQVVVDRQQVKKKWPMQDCSMCGDVGFPDQLQHCTRCRSRFQHSYCCNSREGIGSPTWICDWCRLVKTDASEDDKVSQSPISARGCTVSSEESGPLEYLLKAALTEAEAEAGAGTPSADGFSFCSSTTGKGNAKVDEIHRVFRGDQGCSTRIDEKLGKLDIGEDMPTTPKRASSEMKKNSPKIARCTMKVSQKWRQRSQLEQQCASMQIKRLSSMRSVKTGISCEAPKGLVRRYKSLSDISF